MTRRARPVFTAALAAAALLLGGCDAAKAPFAAAAQAEAEGKLDDTITRYEAVCATAARSPLCARAAVRADRLRFRRALGALDERRFAAVKTELDALALTKDAATHDAVAALAVAPDLVQGLAWEQAAAIADTRQALPAIVALAAAHTSIAPEAQAWLEKHRPALLLEDVKAACGPEPARKPAPPPAPPDGGAPAEDPSCSELGKQMAVLHPGAPEAAEAARIVAAEYRRMYPSLLEAERLIQQQNLFALAKAKIGDCMETLGPQIDPGGMRMGSIRDICETRTGTIADAAVTALNEAWSVALGQIRDPAIFKALQKRMSEAEFGGGVQPVGWPPPAPEKK